MSGGFERKPGGTSLVQAVFGARSTPGTPGKQTLVELVGAVQHKASSAAEASVARATASSGAGVPLEPSLRRDMERSFGTDFSSVQVHHGSVAAALGARAFTRGESIHVAPGEYDPSSHSSRSLIGHELAHVVQQRAGGVAAPQGFGGLAINDDPGLEAEADQAGDRAARGEPAGITAIGAGADSVHAPVQAKLRWSRDLNWINAKTNPAIASKFATLAEVEDEADTLSGGTDVEVVAEQPSVGAAAFSFQKQQVALQPMPKDSETAIESLSGGDVHDRVIALAHELRHVCDAFQSDDKLLRSAMRKVAPWEELIHSEWRAHATQARAAIEIANKQGGQAVPSRHKDLIDQWRTTTFDISRANEPQSMFAITKSYIWQYSKQQPTDKQVTDFIAAHSNWVTEAFTLCPPLDAGGVS